MLQSVISSEDFFPPNIVYWWIVSFKLRGKNETLSKSFMKLECNGVSCLKVYESFCTWPYPSRRRHDFFFKPISWFWNEGMVWFIIFKCLVLTILHYSQIADGKMEKCGELPAAEPEIEPRCPGLVSKLPGLSRRAMRRLQCRGIFQ